MSIHLRVWTDLANSQVFFLSVILRDLIISFIGHIAAFSAYKCSLLLQSTHVAWSVCLSGCVRVLGTRVSCAQKGWPHPLDGSLSSQD